jgi:oligopeptidase A
MDMALHSDFDASKESIFDVQKRVASKFIPHQMPLDGDRFLCAFAHVFAGGYAAGYYSYKWAEVMSADSFSAFEELETEDQRKEMGLRFRQTVLALGGGMHPTQVFTKFRGRAPNPEALLRHNGLA